MTIEILYDEQTHHGRLLRTRRTWKAPNGHKVIVTTDSCINSRSTWGDRNSAYARWEFRCECGRRAGGFGAPRKQKMNEHDKWWTKEQEETMSKSLERLLK